VWFAGRLMRWWGRCSGGIGEDGRIVSLGQARLGRARPSGAGCGKASGPGVVKQGEARHVAVLDVVHSGVEAAQSFEPLGMCGGG